MSTEPDVEASRRPPVTHHTHPVTPAELPAVGRALARAFVNDPIWAWLTGSRHEHFAERAVGFFKAEARHYIHVGGAWTTEGNLGAALWAPPRAWKLHAGTIATLAGPALRVFGTRLPKALGTLADIDKKHPSEPHWYLGMLGTDPDHQGRGVGSALLAPVLERCDHEGLPAYLESSKESNVPFYERHGFQVTDTHDFKGGPRMWLMWREPVPPMS